MSDLIQLILLCLTGGVVSLLGAFLIINLKNKVEYISNKLTSFAAGVLLTVGVLDLLPEAIEQIGDTKNLAWAVLLGILFVFLLEKTGLWFHHHDGTHGKHPPVVGIFVGDMLHNMIDGMAIGASFMIGTKMGILTTMAVAFHELPKEMADFMIYTRSGLSDMKTILMNLASSLMAVVGGLLVYSIQSEKVLNQGYLLGLTAGMFLFVALGEYQLCC